MHPLPGHETNCLSTNLPWWSPECPTVPPQTHYNQPLFHSKPSNFFKEHDSNSQRQICSTNWTYCSCGFSPLGVFPWNQSYQMGQAGRDHRELSSPASLLKQVHPRTHGTGLHPDNFWVSLEKETSPFLWAICSSALSPSQYSSPSCSGRILHFCLCLLSLILLPGIPKESLALSSWHSPFRYLYTDHYFIIIMGCGSLVMKNINSSLVAEVDIWNIHRDFNLTSQKWELLM